MKNHTSGKCLNHKNLARLEFIRSLNPVVAEKLKNMLQEHREKEKGK
ncbi:tail protein [Pantoea phage PA-1]